MSRSDRAPSERECLLEEIRLAAALTDQDRIRILRDLLETLDAIRRTKTPEDLDREEEARRILEELPGRARYEDLARRLG